jgi:hypothetical protein
MRDRFRCRPVVKNRGQLGLWKRSEDKTPSTTTALRSTSETAPAPRVVYQRTVSVIGEGDYEPPETATPELDDELTEVEDDCNPFDVEAVLVEALVVDNGVTPGIVLALTAPSKPTPATAANATPAVSRLSIWKAASRALILVASFFAFSMVPLWRERLDPPCENPERTLRIGSPSPLQGGGLGRGSLPGRAGERGATTLAVDFSRHALVAQGIEQDGPNVKVGGSIPSGGTICAA